jgi:hypothetical protein
LKRILIVILIVCICQPALLAQSQFSLASDASILRNLSPHQKFWSFGQTIQGMMHFTPKETGYLWVGYYSPGKFSNGFTATAKSSSVSPQQINYVVHGTWRPRHISIGWRHYYKGAFNNENGLNIYSIAGFGILVSKVENTFNVQVDTANYIRPAMPAEGTSSFRRLTFDVGLGAEYAVGFDIYLYSDVRTWISASDAAPSLYFHDTQKVPMPLIINFGVRLLFGSPID